MNETGNELNEHELISIMLESLREAAGYAKDLNKVTKNSYYGDIARNLMAMSYLAEKLAKSKAMTESALLSMVDRAVEFNGRQQPAGKKIILQ